MNNLEIKDMNVTTTLDKNISLIGPSLSGKTYMLNKLINKVNNKDIYIDGISIKEYSYKCLRKSIMVVFNDNNFECDNVVDEIENNISKVGIELDINEILKNFKLTRIKNKSILTLPSKYRAYIKIISYLVLNPVILGIDSLYEYLDDEMRKTIDDYSKEKNVCLIKVIYNLDYLDMDDNVILLNNMKAVFSGTSLSLLKGNSILPYLGYKLPFITDLSQNLVLYGLLDDVFVDDEKVVDSLWN